MVSGAEPAPNVVLRLDGVSKSYGAVKAVDGVTLDVFEGEILTLLGPSGCGKTTTLRILAGLEEPDAGELYAHSRPLVSVSRGIFVPPHKRNVGMVFQSYAIWPHMSVFDNVAYPLRVRHVKHHDVRERVLRTLALVGLEGLESRQGPQLSGGQQQRVALARALVYEPSVLLMDEPFSNLDAKLREQMRSQIRALLKRLERMTVVFVTHDQIEALSLSDRIVVMNQGRIDQVDSPEALYERPATPFARDFIGRTIRLYGKLEPRAGTVGGLAVRLDSVPGALITGPALSRNGFAPGMPVCACVRPEHVQLQRGGGSDLQVNELPGIVDSIVFLGDQRECRIKLADGEWLQLYTPQKVTVAEGDEVRLSVSPEGLTVWAA